MNNTQEALKQSSQADYHVVLAGLTWVGRVVMAGLTWVGKGASVMAGGCVGSSNMGKEGGDGWSNMVCWLV